MTMRTNAAPTAIPTAAASAATLRLAWPLGAREMRLPAKPMRHRDTPALIWRALLRRSWWRLQRELRPQPVPRPHWC
jgi:hypothetical protein